MAKTFQRVLPRGCGIVCPNLRNRFSAFIHTDLIPLLQTSFEIKQDYINSVG